MAEASHILFLRRAARLCSVIGLRDIGTSSSLLLSFPICGHGNETALEDGKEGVDLERNLSGEMRRERTRTYNKTRGWMGCCNKDCLAHTRWWWCMAIIFWLSWSLENDRFCPSPWPAWRSCRDWPDAEGAGAGRTLHDQHGWLRCWGDEAIVITNDIQTTESRLVEWHEAGMTFK